VTGSSGGLPIKNMQRTVYCAPPPPLMRKRSAKRTRSGACRLRRARARALSVQDETGLEAGAARRRAAFQPRGVRSNDVLRLLVPAIM